MDKEKVIAKFKVGDEVIYYKGPISEQIGNTFTIVGFTPVGNCKVKESRFLPDEDNLRKLTKLDKALK